jgi:hypothetical protein
MGWECCGSGDGRGAYSRPCRRTRQKKFYWYTTYGTITVEESCLLDKATKKLVRPFSEAAGVRCRSHSLPLERAITDFGVDIPFGQVAAKLQEHYGISVAVCAARTITERVACDLAEADCLPAESDSHTTDRLIAETDGGMIPIVKTQADAPDARKGKVLYWREAKVCLVQRQGETVPKVGITMGGPAEAGLLMKQLALALGFNARTHLHCVGDGAQWIADQIEVQFGAQGRFLVDLFHVCDYLAPASKVCAPDAARDWLQSRKKRLLAGQAADLIAELKLHVEPKSVDEEHAPVRAAWRYLANRLEQLDYPRALALDLPVGSGAIESAHRYLVQARLKRPGAWWREDMAQAMLNLRVMRQNRLWEAYWEKRWTQPLRMAA